MFWNIWVVYMGLPGQDVCGLAWDFPLGTNWGWHVLDYLNLGIYKGPQAKPARVVPGSCS